MSVSTHVEEDQITINFVQSTSDDINNLLQEIDKVVKAAEWDLNRVTVGRINETFRKLYNSLYDDISATRRESASSNVNLDNIALHKVDPAMDTMKSVKHKQNDNFHSKDPLDKNSNHFKEVADRQKSPLLENIGQVNTSPSDHEEIVMCPQHKENKHPYKSDTRDKPRRKRSSDQSSNSPKRTSKKQKINSNDNEKTLWQIASHMEKRLARRNFINPLGISDDYGGLVIILNTKKPNSPCKHPKNKPRYSGARDPNLQVKNIRPSILLTIYLNGESEKQSSCTDDYLELNDNLLMRELNKEYKKIMQVEDFFNSPNRVIMAVEDSPCRSIEDMLEDISATSFSNDVEETFGNNSLQENREMTPPSNQQPIKDRTAHLPLKKRWIIQNTFTNKTSLDLIDITKKANCNELNTAPDKFSTLNDFELLANYFPGAHGRFNSLQLSQPYFNFSDSHSNKNKTEIYENLSYEPYFNFSDSCNDKNKAEMVDKFSSFSALVTPVSSPVTKTNLETGDVSTNLSCNQTKLLASIPNDNSVETSTISICTKSTHDENRNIPHENTCDKILINTETLSNCVPSEENTNYDNKILTVETQIVENAQYESPIDVDAISSQTDRQSQDVANVDISDIANNSTDRVPSIKTEFRFNFDLPENFAFLDAKDTSSSEDSFCSAKEELDASKGLEQNLNENKKISGSSSSEINSKNEIVISTDLDKTVDAVSVDIDISDNSNNSTKTEFKFNCNLSENFALLDAKDTSSFEEILCSIRKERDTSKDLEQDLNEDVIKISDLNSDESSSEDEIDKTVVKQLNDLNNDIMNISSDSIISIRSSSNSKADDNMEDFKYTNVVPSFIGAGVCINNNFIGHFKQEIVKPEQDHENIDISDDSRTFTCMEDDLIRLGPPSKKDIICLDDASSESKAFKEQHVLEPSVDTISINNSIDEIAVNLVNSTKIKDSFEAEQDLENMDNSNDVNVNINISDNANKSTDNVPSVNTEFRFNFDLKSENFAPFNAKDTITISHTSDIVCSIKHMLDTSADLKHLNENTIEISDSSRSGANSEDDIVISSDLNKTVVKQPNDRNNDIMSSSTGSISTNTNMPFSMGAGVCINNNFIGHFKQVVKPEQDQNIDILDDSRTITSVDDNLVCLGSSSKKHISDCDIICLDDASSESKDCNEKNVLEPVVDTISINNSIDEVAVDLVNSTKTKDIFEAHTALEPSVIEVMVYCFDSDNSCTATVEEQNKTEALEKPTETVEVLGQPSEEQNVPQSSTDSNNANHTTKTTEHLQEENIAQNIANEINKNNPSDSFSEQKSKLTMTPNEPQTPTYVKNLPNSTNVTPKLELPPISSEIGVRYSIPNETSHSFPNINVINPSGKNYTVTSLSEFNDGCSKLEDDLSKDLQEIERIYGAGSNFLFGILSDQTDSKYDNKSKLETSSHKLHNAASTTVSFTTNNSSRSFKSTTTGVQRPPPNNENKQNKPSGKDQTTTGVKRRASDDHENEPKRYKPSRRDQSKPSSSTASRENYDNKNYRSDPRWALYNFSNPEDCFKAVYNQWFCGQLPDPHEDLTYRFHRDLFYFPSTFTIPGNDQIATTECLSIYDNQIDQVTYEMNTLRQDLDLYGAMWSRREIGRAMERLSKLRGIYAQLLTACREARHFYKYYVDPQSGWNARYITSYRRNEIGHLLNILEAYPYFYGH